VAGWVRVSGAEAEAHRLYGLGGWLRVISALMVLSVPGGVVLTWQQWVDPALGAAAVASNLLGLLVLGAQIGMAVLWFRLWPGFRPGYAVLAVVGTAGLALADAVIGPPGGPASADPVGDLVLEVAFHLAFLAYMQTSRRFRVTFEHRVKAGEGACGSA
jgi:hypothetical protein